MSSDSYQFHNFRQLQETKGSPLKTLSMENNDKVSRDVNLERKLLELSGEFDMWFYVTQAGRESLSDPIGHYLTVGWLLGHEPNPTFPGSTMLPYYATLGCVEPPLLTWLTLRSAGWFTPGTLAELDFYATRIRNTQLFDQVFYLAQLGRSAYNLDAATHYVLVGEALGLAASEKFDAAYYRDRYPDIARSNISPLIHYVDHGLSEGRVSHPLITYRRGKAAFDDSKQNVIVVCHETSRTGAPILGWNIASSLSERYNVHTIYLGDGELTPDFERVSTHILGPFGSNRRHEADFEPAVRDVLASRKFVYAIVNSAEARAFVPLFAREYVSSIMLVHEFGAYVYPANSFRSALDWATDVVFPAAIVANAAAEIHPVFRMRTHHICPQGAPVLPVNTQPTESNVAPALAELARQRKDERLFIVLGAGAIQIRKGVELFIAAAAAAIRCRSPRKIHFLWVGHGFRPKEDMAYSMYLQEQVSRSHLSDHITFLDAVSDLTSVYRNADAFFLSSRLDPLPNVSIDAAMMGIPIVCFRNASGTAELLSTDPAAALGIVDHLDAEAAGKFIVDLAGDEALHRRMSQATQSLARRRFDMSEYIAHLDALGTAGQHRMHQRAKDALTLMSDSSFDQDMFLGTTEIVETRERTIARYLALGAARTWEPILIANTELRRPSPGFNPRIFASTYPETSSGDLDPLAEYVRRGKPAGPWQSQVLRPDDEDGQIRPSGHLQVALHAHMFHTDLVQDFLLHLSPNQTKCDLWVTTSDEVKADQLRRALKTYRNGDVEVSVVPNRGRNFGPLLTSFPPRFAAYDLIGHVHSKLSVGKQGGWDKGSEWREFLWQNLLGGHFGMLDRIVVAFEHQSSLGLVFPSDPHLVGWDENLPAAEALAKRLNLTGPLPRSLDFPLGSMFWARREALQPLFQVEFDWEDYPAEPLNEDGTILHALERMMPTICCDASGLRFAVTHVPGVSWTS